MRVEQSHAMGPTASHFGKEVSRSYFLLDKMDTSYWRIRCLPRSNFFNFHAVSRFPLGLGKVAAGPGFHRVGAPSRRGRQPTIWPKFAKNCMKIKKIGPRVGTHPKLYYVDPPLKSQGILNRLEKSGKITQYTGKLREFSLSNFLFPRYFPLF